MLDDVQNAALKEKFNKSYDPKNPIIIVYKHIDKCLAISNGADDVNFTTGKVLQNSLYAL